jgi:propionyl-CoA carboxylase beta chain
MGASVQLRSVFRAVRSRRRQSTECGGLQRIKEYEDQFSNPYRAAERGSVDDVIDPKETRRKLAQAFELLATKRDSCPEKKHGNIPL